MKKLDLVGKKFGKLTVLSLLDDRGKFGRTHWLCLCECGKETTVVGAQIKSGHTRSCGCLALLGNHTTHGKTQTREFQLWQSAIRRAKKQGLPFSLEVKDITIPEVCPVLGIKFNEFRNHHARFDSPSIDRLIPQLGYIPSNIRVISYKANTIKQNAPWQEILSVAMWVKKEVEESQCKEKNQS